ncbi:unnamed protein product [Ectocarpus fasciculatus]
MEITDTSAANHAQRRRQSNRVLNARRTVRVVSSTKPRSAGRRHAAASSFATRMSTTTTTTAAILGAVIAYCCLSAPFLAEAFLLPPARAVLAQRETAATARVMAAKGFGKSVEPPSPAPAATGGEEGGGKAPESDGLTGVGSWEKEYKAYIKRTGQYLCSMSWEGHEEMGRGAIFANYDDARKEDKLNETDKFGGIPSMYVPLTEFESMKAAGQEAGEEDDLGQIVRRVKDYRPEREFVVVFQAAGVMGADIVRPNVSPPEMAKHVVKSDGVSTMPSDTGLDGVIDVN